ncbi:MAG: hypothetical protein RLZZ245_3927 [Verrucomicrobiota bacterium]
MKSHQHPIVLQNPTESFNRCLFSLPRLGTTPASEAICQKLTHPHPIKALLTTFSLFAAFAIQPLAAELPALQNQPWLGYFAVHASKRYEFKVAAADGEITLIPVGEGAPILGNLLINIDLGIEETLPDGTTVLKPVRADTIESADPATDQLSKSIIRAKTVGEASLEITIEQSRGIVFIGSRVLDPGTIKNPIRGVVTAIFPNVNPPAKEANNHGELDERDAKRAAKKEAKAAEDRLKDDSIDLKWTDGKRQKITFEKVVDASSAEINGPGIAAAEIKIAAYGNKKFFFTAAPNSAVKLSNTKPASLSEGFSIQWAPDLTKDKDGKARLALEVK